MLRNCGVLAAVALPVLLAGCAALADGGPQAASAAGDEAPAPLRHVPHAQWTPADAATRHPDSGPGGQSAAARATITAEAPGQYPHEPRLVTVPLIVDLTGDLSQLGREGLAGILMAASDYNGLLAAAGSDWYLAFSIADSGSDPARYAAALDHADAGVVVGCTGSGQISAGLDVMERRGMVMVAACSSSPYLAIPGDGLFRLYPDDTNVVPIMLEMLDDAGVKAAVLAVRNDTWGSAIGDMLHARLAESVTVSYMPGTDDYPGIADRLAAAVAQYVDEYGAAGTAVVTVGFGETADIMAEAAGRDLLGDVRWFGSNGNARHPDITAKAAEFAQAVSLTAPMNADPAVPARIYASELPPEAVPHAVQATIRIDDYVRQSLPVAYAAAPTGYDAMWLAALTLDSVGGADAAAFAAAFPDVAALHHGTTGPARLNAAGDMAAASYDIWAVSGGQWEYVSRYDGLAGAFLSASDMERQAAAIMSVRDMIRGFDADAAAASARLVLSETHGYGTEAFVANDAGLILAHSAGGALAYDPAGLARAAEGASQGGSWTSYGWPDPDTGDVRPAVWWVRTHAGYVFASGIHPDG